MITLNEHVTINNYFNGIIVIPVRGLMWSGNLCCYDSNYDIDAAILFILPRKKFSVLDYLILVIAFQFGDFPHLLISGPRGAGKMTRVFCILNELYGAGVQNVWGDAKTFQTPSGKQLEIRTFSSKYHIQLCPA